MRISDWSSDVCSSDLERVEIALLHIGQDDILAVRDAHLIKRILLCQIGNKVDLIGRSITRNAAHGLQADRGDGIAGLLVRGDIMPDPDCEIWIAEVDVITQVSIIAGVTKMAADTVKFGRGRIRSEEHTSELQSLMRISYAV